MGAGTDGVREAPQQLTTAAPPTTAQAPERVAHPGSASARLLALQRQIGNRAVVDLTGAAGTTTRGVAVHRVQRLALDGPWTTFSHRGLPKRSAKLQALDTAVANFVTPYGAFQPAEIPAVNVPTARNLLHIILEHIEAWRATKRSLTGAINSARAADVDTLEQEVQAKLLALGALSANQQAAARQAWDPHGAEFTDPAAHNAGGQWRYLVNALTPADGDPTVAYRDAIQKDPKRFKKNSGVLSTSYITEQLNTLWAPSGYVLRAPPENIMSAAPNDLGSDSQLLKRNKKQEAARLANMHGLSTPAELRQAGRAGGHNEIAMSATGVEIIGIFIVEHPGRPQTVLDFAKPILDGTDQPLKVGLRTVYEPEPSVSAQWIQNYNATSRSKNIPIIWLPQAPGATIAMLTKRPGWKHPANLDPRTDVWLADLSDEEKADVANRRKR